MDVFDEKKRSDVMSRIKSKNTKPERIVRSYLHRRGLRYRLHDRKLPGAPDLVFASRRVAVFVHGCFWHGHEGCKKATIPKTRSEFWEKKILGNRERDIRHRRELEARGWRVIEIWECEIKEEGLEGLYSQLVA